MLDHKIDTIREEIIRRLKSDNTSEIEYIRNNNYTNYLTQEDLKTIEILEESK